MALYQHPSVDGLYFIDTPGKRRALYFLYLLFLLSRTLLAEATQCNVDKLTSITVTLHSLGLFDSRGEVADIENQAKILRFLKGNPPDCILLVSKTLLRLLLLLLCPYTWCDDFYLHALFSNRYASSLIHKVEP